MTKTELEKALKETRDLQKTLGAQMEIVLRENRKIRKEHLALDAKFNELVKTVDSAFTNLKSKTKAQDDLLDEFGTKLRKTKS